MAHFTFKDEGNREILKHNLELVCWALRCRRRVHVIEQWDAAKLQNEI